FRHSYMKPAELEKVVGTLLEKGWIEKSLSPWTSNIFAVSKKDPKIGHIL
ncbi:Retroelement pol Polyprotein, partial [Phytophthora megakarya]